MHSYLLFQERCIAQASKWSNFISVVHSPFASNQLSQKYWDEASYFLVVMCVRLGSTNTDWHIDVRYVKTLHTHKVWS